MAEAALGGVVPGARAPRPRDGGAGAGRASAVQVVVRGPGDVWVSASSAPGAPSSIRARRGASRGPRPRSAVGDHPRHGTSNLPLPRCNGLRSLIAPTPRDACSRRSGGSRQRRLHEVTFGIADLPEGRTILATVPDVATGDRLVRAIQGLDWSASVGVAEDQGAAPGAPAALSASGVGERGGGRVCGVARSTRHLEGLAQGPWSDLAGVERVVEPLALAEKRRLVAGVGC